MWMNAELGPEADHQEVARAIAAIAVEAGRIAAAAQDRTLGRVEKADGSPSTAADLASEALILRRLAALFPEVPVVAEEAGAAPHGEDLLFLVDPLDGTREYLAGTDEYAVNIALVRGGRPVAAAIAAPGRARVWAAGGIAEEAPIPAAGPPLDWVRIATRAAPAGRVALVSRRHGDPAEDVCLEPLGVTERRTAGSALKFGLIASGEADLYVRCGPTMEWDSAAGDLIVTRAGGSLVGPDGGPPSYGHAARGYRNGPFAVLGDPSLAAAVRLPESCS
jgi:3'(2'), 5'-bisphosphate nucleotidase